MEVKYIILIIVGIILLIIICNYINTLNSLKKLSLKVDEALSGIDVALSKRYNVLSKMMETVKGYTKYEKEVLFKTIEMRSNMNLSELKNAKNDMDENINQINMIIEKYPDLKANENFLALQKAIIDAEEHLQAARRLYNSNTSLYNEKVITFPSLIVAKIHHFKQIEYFEIEEKEKNIKINL